MVAGEITGKRVVVDEVSGWLTLFDDGTVDRSWTGPPEARFLTDFIPPYSTPKDGLTLHDLRIDPPLRLYLPSAQRGRSSLPILLHFHGGGFCISHPAWRLYHHFYARLARSVPAVIVSVELPLAPENRLPAAFDAGYRALLWLRSLAKQTETSGGAAAEVLVLLPTLFVDKEVEQLCSVADFSRVFLIGDSSGGNIVHEVAARAGAEKDDFWDSATVCGGILLHPGFARSVRSRSEMDGSRETPFLTLDMLDKFLSMGLPAGATKDHPFTCPMGAAAPEMAGLRLPPLMVAVADRDLISDTNEEYCKVMRAAGKDMEVVVSAGVGHSFYLNKIAVDCDPVTAERTEELILAVKSFIDRH